MLSLRHILRYPPARFFHSSFARLKQCPSCSKPLPSPLPVCNSCWHISHLPNDIKFHDIFDLPYDPNPFVVDLASLKQKFRSTQALCHPDTWASRGPQQQDVAQTLSARVNEAYSCLLNPLARAEYILGRHHIPVSETDQVNDIEFMSEVMQLRESIEEAVDAQEVQTILDDNSSGMVEVLKTLENLIGKRQWEDVKFLAVKLRYLQGIERAAKQWLESHL